MTGQRDAAAERSAGEPAREGAEWPVVEVAPGVWRLRAIVEMEAENERLRAEVASLRLTLGGRTLDASVPEPVGCPCPGACSTVAEIERLRAIVAAQEATR